MIINNNITLKLKKYFSHKKNILLKNNGIKSGKNIAEERWNEALITNNNNPS